MRARKKSFVIVSFNKLFFDFYRELGMLGSPTLDSLSSAAGDVKYPADCYSPKFMDQRDTYRANVLGMMQTGIKSENWTPLGLSNHPYHYGYEPSPVLSPSTQNPPTH